MNTEAGTWEEVEVEKKDKVDDEFGDIDDSNFIETIVMDEIPVSESSVDTAELQVDKLIAQVEAENDEDVVRRKKVRQRLEQLSEDMNLDDTYAFDLEDGD
jgi:hypothetical protein